MKSNRKSEEEFQKLYEELIRISQRGCSPEKGREDRDSKLYRTYSIHTESGHAFYQWLTEEQLLEILRQEAAKRQHSPSQKELFWVWREYIKERFRRWPYALKAAGLSKSAGAGGKKEAQRTAEQKEYQELLFRVREKAEELCRIPHPSDVPELCEKLKNYTDNWNEIIRDAELNPDFFRNKSVYLIGDTEKEYHDILQKLKSLADSLGRSPLKSEIEEDTRKMLVKRFGSWRNVLYQIGLEPVVRMNPFSATRIREPEKERTHRSSLYDCYYRILNPSPQTEEDLEELYKIRETLGYEPDKKEISPELRKRLQTACGSWANALFQLRYRDGEK